MPGYILTGAPGSGKTALLRLLETEGHPVVEEAATDVIALEQALGNAEPWTESAFIGKVLELQQQRQRAARVTADSTTFFDRSPLCTLALCRYLGFEPPRHLAAEIDRVTSENTYSTTVFLIRNQGFVQPTAARRITLEQSLAFEKLHEDTYRHHGFHLTDIPPAPLPTRATQIWQAITRLRRSF